MLAAAASAAALTADLDTPDPSSQPLMPSTHQPPILRAPLVVVVVPTQRRLLVLVSGAGQPKCQHTSSAKVRATSGQLPAAARCRPEHFRPAKPSLRNVTRWIRARHSAAAAALEAARDQTAARVLWCVKRLSTGVRPRFAGLHGARDQKSTGQSVSSNGDQVRR